MTIQTTYIGRRDYGMVARCGGKDCPAEVSSKGAPAALLAELARLGWRGGYCPPCISWREGGR